MWYRICSIIDFGDATLKLLKELTQQDVIDLVLYDPISGKCYWRVRGVQWFSVGTHNSAQQNCNSWNKKNAGKEIVRKTDTGYITPRLLGSNVKLHRLIWFRETGEWPDQIDHINGVRLDNRWCNLRNVSVLENNRNLKKRRTNKSGMTGVSYSNERQKWCASIGVNGRVIPLGRFNVFEDAVAARKAAEIKYGFSETHGRD